MPEYLAPGVYVEEIPSSNKPIAAASTSTAAMVGLTERGPVNTPTLCTSLGSYNRQFGSYLNPLEFLHGHDALPYAAEGFFNNGGSRLYITRIAGTSASESTIGLFANEAISDFDVHIFEQAVAEDGKLMLSSILDLTDLDSLLVLDGDSSETVIIDLNTTPPQPFLSIDSGLEFSYEIGATLTLQDQTQTTGKLQALAEVGTNILSMDDISDIPPGTVLVISSATDSEYISIDSDDALTNTVTLISPLSAEYDTTATLVILSDSTTITTDLGESLAPTAARVTFQVADTAGLATGAILKLKNTNGDEEFAVVSGNPFLVNIETVGDVDTLSFNHPRGTRLIEATEVLTVHARYPGIWGDQLRLSTHPASQVQTRSLGISASTSNQITLQSAFGLFPGSVLIIGNTDPETMDAGELLMSAEVETVNTGSGVVTLKVPLGLEVADDTPVISQEFTLLVERIDNGKAVESETFERLSLAVSHPRYALTIVGSFDTASATASTSGQSALVRLSDAGAEDARQLPLVAGLTRMLTGGDDDLATVDDFTYIGESSEDPDTRTGIQAMENESTLSIVAVPGRTTVNVQKALLAHCEKMRYRFAVIDSPLRVSLNTAREYRQNFDNTRAAIYYPGLVIADPFGSSGDTRAIHPCGHVMGVYARTDMARGVHKAPANEVVRSILNFETKLAKGEQDILNPINLNCFRDFRTENRGLRIYGGRVATSDPEWRYVSVRRLLLFIEQSLDTGLQWAVFEPNSKPLWDTVKQSITNFLTTVWRSGALEGTKPDEAFYVRIGYDITMTQDDIDNGRMIVEIGVAPVKPAEFVIVRISQKTREATG